MNPDTHPPTHSLTSDPVVVSQEYEEAEPGAHVPNPAELKPVNGISKDITNYVLISMASRTIFSSPMLFKRNFE